MIELRPAGFKRKTMATAQQCSSRLKPSGGMEAAPKHVDSQIPSPFLVGATLQLRPGGGFTAVRRPPLCAKGLPSATQVNKGLAKSAQEERKIALKNSSKKASGADQGHGPTVELGADIKKEFAARIARRDDVLQVNPMSNDVGVVKLVTLPAGISPAAPERPECRGCRIYNFWTLPFGRTS